jgi:uncharacterized protein YoxC|tara:strand:- start:4325 stop:5065 length:741 start_codon:yes stop_codon:yes gene_type:complete
MYVLAFVAVLVVVLITINAISQRREYVAAQHRQEASRYRARASDTQDLLDKVKTVSLDGRIKAALIERVIENLEQAKQTASDLPGIDNAIQAAITERETVATQTSNGGYILPNDEGELAKVVKNLRKIRKIFVLMYQRGKVQESDYKELAPDLDLLILKINVETFIKLGHVAKAQAQYGSARQHYTRAYNSILKSGINTPYAQEKLQALKDLLAITEAEKPKGPAPDEGEEKDENLESLFGQKKKW